MLLAQARDAERGGNMSAAVSAYRRAANAGSGAAAKRLSELYAKGGNGVDRDAQQANFWTNKAKALGESVGCGPVAMKAGATVDCNN